jgi:hypothetical protein
MYMPSCPHLFACLQEATCFFWNAPGKRGVNDLINIEVRLDWSTPICDYHLDSFILWIIIGATLPEFWESAKHKFLPVLFGIEVARADDVHVVGGDQILRGT